MTDHSDFGQNVKASTGRCQRQKRHPFVKANEKLNDGATGVNYPQNVFSGIRKTVGFKCDIGLHREFKRVAQDRMGSVCHPLECFEIAFLALNREQVNFGTTVVIQNLNITRELRTRRKIIVNKCGFKDCVKPAIAEGIWRDKKIFPLCEKHLQEAKNDPKTWRIA